MKQNKPEYSSAPRETPDNGVSDSGTTQRSKRSNIKWVAIGAVVLLLIGLMARRVLQGRAAAEKAAAEAAARPAPLQSVSVVAAQTGNVLQTLAVTGTLRSQQDIDLSPKISGRVESILVREGQRVQRGQLLVTLDDADQRAQLAQARAGLQSAQVRLKQQEVGLPARVAEINTAIEQAEANLQSAQAKFKQAQLQEPAEVQNRQAAVDQAQANLQTAQARYKQAQLQEPARVQSARAAVANAEEGLKAANARLEQAKVTAKQTQEQVEAEVERAQAGVEQSQAALAEVRRGSREQQVAQAQAQVREAEVRVRNTATELERAKILFNGGAAPKSSVDTAQTQYDLAQAQLTSAKQNLSLVQEGATNEQIRQAEEAVRQAQAQLAQAEAGRGRVPVAQGEVTAALAVRAQAQAALRTAQTELSQIPVAAQDVRIASEAVEQARAQLETAKAGLAQVPITRQATRIARQAVEQAQAQLNQARANRANIPVAQQDVEAARAAVESARAQVQLAQVALDNTRIAAPVSGVVNKKLTDVGEAVGPSAPLLNLVALNTVYFEAQLSENNIRNVQEGDTVQVTVPAVSDQAFEGFVSDIIPVADPQSRQFRVRITVADAPRQLTPGAFARGQIVTEGLYNALSVPDEAIRRDNGQTYVLVAPGTDDTATVERRDVKIGLSAAGRTAIVSGVEKSARVVIGEPTLKAGEKVKVTAAESDMVVSE